MVPFQTVLYVVLFSFAIAEPMFRPLPQLNPVMRYRLKTSDDSPLANLRPVRATPLASSGRNCFFSPVQCRLPVSQMKSMDNSRRRLFTNDQPPMGPFDRIRRFRDY